jgi:hypothetical protein
VEGKVVGFINAPSIINPEGVLVGEVSPLEIKGVLSRAIKNLHGRFFETLYKPSFI